MGDNRRQRLVAWIAAGFVMCAVSCWTLYRVAITFGKHGNIQTGLDFSNNTWRAVRGLLAGQNIYGATHAVIPGIGPAWPASQHVPGSLLWQAPFAALPLKAALLAFTVASLAAIWAAVLVLTWPREPWAILLTACCGAFAICLAGGPMTLLLGQPTGFILLGIAIVVRARNRPWLAAAGFVLAASTLQTGIPFALALLVLGCWPVVWRGTLLIAACSVPPAAAEIATSGFRTFAVSFLSGAGAHLDRLSNRIDLGGLLDRLGLHDATIGVVAGGLIALAALAFLARLPVASRQIGNPPVLCLVIAFTLLCTYHQAYDMLLVGGVIIPVILITDQTRAMLPAFGIAGISGGFSTDVVGLLVCPAGLIAICLISARAAWAGASRSTEPDTGAADPGAVSALPAAIGASREAAARTIA
jgi:Glycosyltransferase family 87